MTQIPDEKPRAIEVLLSGDDDAIAQLAELLGELAAEQLLDGDIELE